MHCLPLPLHLRCSCVLMCHSPRKEYYKKFLFEPLPGGWVGWLGALAVLGPAGAGWLQGCRRSIVRMHLASAAVQGQADNAAPHALPCHFPAPPAVESHLDHFLHDHMAAEVVTR